MADWHPRDARIGHQPIANTETTQAHPLCSRTWARHETFGEGEFIYLKGVGSTVTTSWVTFDHSTGLTTLLAANAVGPVAIAMSANASTTSYGWYQIYGAGYGKSANAIAINTQIYGAGSGTVDDAVVDGDMIHNAKCISTIAGAVTTGTFQIWYPYADDITTND